MRRFFSLFCILVCALSLNVGAASSTQVALVGVVGKKAVLVIDGGEPKTLGLGESTREGVRLLEVGSDGAVVEVVGRRQRIALGEAPLRLGGVDSGASELILAAATKGHHFANGSVNGCPVRFLIDTGASMVSMGASDAVRAGINFRKGQLTVSQTASGQSRVWRVRLDEVRVGEITLRGVDGLVHENDLPFVLLGMSFLNRMDMLREGDRLVLRKRF